MPEPAWHEMSGNMHLGGFLRSGLIGAALVASLSIDAQTAGATPYDTLQSIAGAYNVFLLGNIGDAAAPFQYSDTQGKVAVAGNATLNGGVGIQNLAVRGSLTDQNGAIGGNVFVGGVSANLTGGVTINGSSSLTVGNSPTGVYITASTQVHDPGYWAAPATGGGPATQTTPIDLFGSSTDIVNASNSLTGLTGAADIRSSGGVVNITLNNNGLNVIDLSGLNGATITGINITNATGVTPTGLVIHVAGDNLDFNGDSFSLGSLGTNQVLFNFGNATSLTMANLAFEGALLAQLATVNFTAGHVDSALTANNYIVSAQISYTGFNNPFLIYTAGGSGVPEPASVVIFVTGLLALILMRRRLVHWRAAEC